MPEGNQDIEVRSEEVQEILSAVPNWMIRWGNTLLFLLILILLFIAWFVKYPDVIASEVMITTVNPPEKIYANSNGKFDAILANDGDTVRVDQTLAVIENSSLYKDVLLLKSIVDTFTVDQEDFFFPIDDLPPLNLGEVAGVFANFENDYSGYQLNKKLNPYENQFSANNLSVLEARGRLRSLQTQEKFDREKLSLIEKDLKRQKNLFDRGVISEKEYDQKRGEVLQAQIAYKNTEDAISRARELISTSNKNLRGTSIERVQEESRLLKKTIQSFYLLRNAIKVWEKTYALKASIPGKVSFLSFWDKNQTVKAGDLIFTIIPANNESFIGKIVAPAANSGKIKKGQRVQIKLANYPSEEYGELNGTIQSISLVPDQKGNYLIDVALPEELITTYDKKIAFKQEMKGTADIVTEDLRLIERFFYQLKNIIK